MSYISTVSGKQFHFGDHRRMVEAIDIVDIAHALGNLCRFTGQCWRFYSVAEHSVHVSRMMPDDLARPLKQLVPDYQAVEEQIWQAIAERFELPRTMPSLVKRADMAMLKLEVDHLLPPHCAEELDLPGERADVGLRFWNPMYAKYAFIEQYKWLTRD